MIIRTSSPNRRQGYTIIELAVTCAVVACCFAMVQVAADGSDAGSNLLACQAKLAQLMKSNHLYAGDHEGTLMPLAGDAPWPDKPWGWWHEVLMPPYLGEEISRWGKKLPLLECPADEFLWSHSAPDENERVDSPSYGYNWELGRGENTPFSKQEWWLRKVDEVERPEETVGFADSAHAHELQREGQPLRRTASFVISWEPSTRYPGCVINPGRHGEGSNIAWLDGHVSTPTADEYQDILVGDVKYWARHDRPPFNK